MSYKAYPHPFAYEERLVQAEIKTLYDKWIFCYLGEFHAEIKTTLLKAFPVHVIFFSTIEENKLQPIFVFRKKKLFYFQNCSLTIKFNIMSKIQIFS